MMRDPLAAADPLAERRFAYGRAAGEDGDWTVAAEMFEQALERAPEWAAGWFALGEARERLGDLDAAADAYRAALRADPADALGASARLHLIGRGEAPAGLPAAYVARLFDEYAPRFDAHLEGALGYRAPRLIMEALEAAAPSRRFAAALDLGCGTGLMGEALRPRVDRLAGVDLSPAMIARARERGAYDKLDVGDAAAFLAQETEAPFDLVVAADMLVYVGDLAPLFRSVAAALTADGLFAFSTEAANGEAPRLGPSMRFAHSRAHVEAAAGAAGLGSLLVRSASTRREKGADVPGLIHVLRREKDAASAGGAFAAHHDSKTRRVVAIPHPARRSRVRMIAALSSPPKTKRSATQ